VLEFKELPAAIKDSLPELKMSAHYYTAEPQARFTRINDFNLKEGQALTTGVKLEEITPEGVVLSYQGYRFRMGINESR
jgi:general secretion pathway protein B